MTASRASRRGLTEKGDAHNDPIEPTNAAIGARIRTRRRELTITAKSLGEMIGVSTNQVTAYERGLRRMAAARLHAISLALDVEVSYFFQDLAVGGRRNTPAATSLKPTLTTQQADVSDIIRMAEVASKINNPEARAAIRKLLKGLPMPGEGSESSD